MFLQGSFEKLSMTNLLAFSIWLILFFSFPKSSRAQERIEYEDSSQEYMERMKGIKEEQERIFFSPRKTILSQIKELQNESFNAFVSSVIADLLRKKEQDHEADYLFSSLVLNEPQLISYTDFWRFGVDEATNGLERLSIQKQHPGATFHISSIYLRKNQNDTAARLLNKRAADLGSFEAKNTEFRYFLSDSIIGFDTWKFNSNFQETNYTIEQSDEKSKLIENTLNIFAEKWDYLSLLKLQGSNDEVRRYLWKFSKKGVTVKKYSDLIHPLILECSKNLTREAPFISSLPISPYIIRIMEKNIEEEKYSNDELRYIGNFLGDYFSGKLFASDLQIQTFNLQNSQPDIAKAYNYYNISSQFGHQLSTLKASILNFYFLKLEKDFEKSLEGIQQLESQNLYSKKLLEILGDCYQNGWGTDKNLAKAKEYFERSTIVFGSEYGYEKLFLTKTIIKETPYPFEYKVDKAKVLENISHSEYPINILHFWHQGILPEEYLNTYTLIKEFKNSEMSKLIFASHAGADNILEKSKAMGYRGVIYSVSLPRSPLNKKLYEDYYKKVFEDVDVYGTEEILIEEIGNISPEFDKRWNWRGLPATFVFVEGVMEPYYFDAATPASEIVSFVKNAENMISSDENLDSSTENGILTQ